MIENTVKLTIQTKKSSHLSDFFSLFYEFKGGLQQDRHSLASVPGID